MARQGSLLLAAWAVACIGVPASAYYLPGTYPQEFLPGQLLQGEQCIAWCLIGLAMTPSAATRQLSTSQFVALTATRGLQLN